MHADRFNFRHILAGFLSATLWAGGLSGCGNLAQSRNSGSTPASPSSASETAVSASGTVHSTLAPEAATQRVEQAIAQNLPREIGIPLQSVSCPPQKTLEPGKVFDCHAQIAQGRFPVRVTVKDDTGNLNFKTRQILHLSRAENQLQQSIKQRDKLDVKADCGAKVKLFQKVGETFNCKLKTPTGQVGSATITAISEEGKVDARWKLLPEN
jgi:hypothetical protein